MDMRLDSSIELIRNSWLSHNIHNGFRKELSQIPIARLSNVINDAQMDIMTLLSEITYLRKEVKKLEKRIEKLGGIVK